MLIFCFYGGLSHLNWLFSHFAPLVHRKITTTDPVPRWRFPYIVGFVNNRYPYGGNRWTFAFTGSYNTPYENTDNEPPFEIPKTWVWVSHNELFEISGGSQPPKSKFSETPKLGYVRLYQIRDYGPHPIPVYIPEAMASKTTVKGDILLARYGASLGKVFFAEDGAYNVAMAKVIKLYSGAWIDDMFLYYYYQSDIYQSLVKGNSRSAQAGFNKEDLRTCQHRKNMV